MNILINLKHFFEGFYFWNFNMNKTKFWILGTYISIAKHIKKKKYKLDKCYTIKNVKEPWDHLD